MIRRHLFVYGTLMRSAGHAMHRHLANLEFTGEGYFNGQLYYVDDYPGAVPSDIPEEKVFGELYAFDNPETLTALDIYEGCGPDDAAPTLFVRQLQRVYLPDGALLDAWVYLYNRPVVGLQRIVSGRFLNPS